MCRSVRESAPETEVGAATEAETAGAGEETGSVARG